MRFFFVLGLLLGLAAAAAHAETVELETCIDAVGRPVRGEPDPEMEKLVRAESNGGKRVIRYNPDALPRLSAMAKQFFFAHECARLAMGVAPDAALPPARARHADCVGVSTLRASGLLDERAALAALQAELVFADDEWALLPGPRRAFDLLACPERSAVVLPAATPPSTARLEWDACIRGCGDRLFRCPGGCRGAACDDGCQAAYERCQAACKSP